MVADNSARMNRYRVLSLRGRLAILVQNAPWMCAAAEAPGSRDPKFGASLARANALGERACLGPLSDAEVLEVDSLVSSIVSRQSRLSHFVAESDDSSPSLIADVLRESAHIVIRILLAAKALQTDSFSDATENLNERFHSLLEYMDEAIAVVAGFQSAGQQSRLLAQRFAGIDAQLEQVAMFAESSRPGNSSLLTADEFEQLKRSGQDVGRRGAADGSPGNGPQTSTTGRGSSSAPEVPKKKGLGIGAFFVLLAIMKMISRMDGCGKGPQKAAKPGPQQVREEPQQDLGVQMRELHNHTILQQIERALAEAEEATAAGKTQEASVALQRASADLATLSEADLANDSVARSVVQLAWMCGDMIRLGKTADPLAAYDAGIRAARGLVARGGDADDQSALSALLNNKAYSLHKLGRSSESLELLTEAVRLQLAALETDPGNDQFREFLSDHYASLMEIHVSLHQWQPAVDAAIQERALWTTQSEPLYEAACNLAQLATAIRDCPDEVPERQQWVSELTRQGLEALRAARGSELNLEQEIQQNAVLKILAAD